MALIPPAEAPKPGYYYHYKHDPNASDVCKYAYRVMGIGAHTEEDGVWFVTYLPLYPASVVAVGQQLGVVCFDCRPLAMWMGDVEVGGVTRPRFTPVTDLERLELLTERFRVMYGAQFAA